MPIRLDESLIEIAKATGGLRADALVAVNTTRPASELGIAEGTRVATRNDDFIYVCYANEAYMNKPATQGSGLTPQAPTPSFPR